MPSRAWRKPGRGTEIHIKLRHDASEFADEWKIKQTIRKHSDFVAFPIYVGEEKVNQIQSLWRKNPSEISEEESKTFYQQMTLDFEAPASVIHFSSDAPLNVRAMLFIPTKREKAMFAKRTEPGLMLYCKNVLIDEYCNEMLPKWLSFVIDMIVQGKEIRVDEYHRPKELYAYLVHNGCLRNEYFEWKVDSERFGTKEGCLYYAQRPLIQLPVFLHTFICDRIAIPCMIKVLIQSKR